MPLRKGAKAKSKKGRPRPAMTALYRHYDKDGGLLYVGIALNPARRLAEHKREADWSSRIHRVEIQHFGTRKEALRAEGRAIVWEQPKFNIQKTLPRAGLMNRRYLAALLRQDEKRRLQRARYYAKARARPAKQRQAALDALTTTEATRMA